MLYNEVDAKLDYFLDGNIPSKQDILRKRFDDLRKGSKQKKGLFLDIKGILRQRDRLCPNCFSTRTRKNGYHRSKSFLLKNIGISVNIGQHKCLDCGLSWSVDVNQLFDLLESFKEEMRKFGALLKSEKNSLHKAGRLLSQVIGKQYSHMSIKRWHQKHTKNIEEPNISNEDFSGYYVHDEQATKTGGKKKQRLMLRDITHKYPLAEEIADDKSKETIKKFLIGNLMDKKRIAMIVDENLSYPDIITKDLKMKYQFDLRHLFDHITEEYREECGYKRGHKQYLHLCDELKKQELFDVFYPREKLVSFVEKGVKELDKITDEDKKDEQDIELQKELKKLKHERRKKRRRKGYTHEHKNYTLEEAKKKFEKVKQLKQYYPKLLQKRIDKIEKNWEHYTLFLVDRNVPPTSNLAEQYFSSTLQRSEKKKFRSDDSLNEFLKIERLKKRGMLSALLCGLSFIEILGLFLELFLGI